MGSKETEIVSSNLWVGNLASDVTDSDLTNLFGKHGALDTITSYASRSYAFIYFKRAEDAKAAKNALQGTVVRANAIKIEFARPAKPCKSLWVSGINPSVSKEKLEEEFLKFGKIEDFKFLRDRNAAYVDYHKLEDASQALKSMNGKQIGSDQIRVDFLRSHSSRREHWPDFRDTMEEQFLRRSMGPSGSPWKPHDLIKNCSELTHSGSIGQQDSQSYGGLKRDGQPSNVLWVGYPSSVHIDQQMLHNAMILFGEIEKIKSFPSRHYAFVEFRSVDEARRAKEGLQGRLFNDPRISIMFSDSELAPGKDYAGFYSGIKGSILGIFSKEFPFRAAQVDNFSHNRLMVPNNFPSLLPPNGALGPNLSVKPFGHQGHFEPRITGSELNDSTVLRKLADANTKPFMGIPNWKSSSPTGPGALPTSLGMKPSIRTLPSEWEVFDGNQIQRETKRSRINGVFPIFDSSSPLKKIEDRGLALDQLDGLGLQVDRDVSGPLAIVQGKSPLGQIEAKFASGETGQGHPDHDYIWRGILAKGGTPICHARCVPIGEGIESEIPEVVNCSARTGLDMLTKHYVEAVGFNIVFFLPDSEDDFASYTEFLRYLGDKNRAGVAKFDDGTTLFLVPPSDFLTKILNISGPERLYGVVLKFPHHAPSSTSGQLHSQSLQSQFINRWKISPLPTEYSVVPQKEERVLQVDYSSVLQDDSSSLPKHLVLPGSDSLTSQPVTVNSATMSKAGASLTPELIATLTSLLPGKEKSSGLESTQLLETSSLKPLFPPNAAPDKINLPQVYYDRQTSEQNGYQLHHSGTRFNSLAQCPPQFRTYSTISNTPSYPAEGVSGSPQNQDTSLNLPQHDAVTYRPLTNFAQSGQFSVSPQVRQQYQGETPQKGHGMANGKLNSGSQGSSVYQQPMIPIALSNQAHDGNVSGSDTFMPPATEKVVSELPNHVQQLQSVLYGAGQGKPDVDYNKNQRYQSTLQFAANLLLQIQQQQKTAQAGQEPGNH